MNGRQGAPAHPFSLLSVDNWPDLVDISDPVWTIVTRRVRHRYSPSTGQAPLSSADTRSQPMSPPTGRRFSAVPLTLRAGVADRLRPHRPHAYGGTTTGEYSYLQPIEIQISPVDIFQVHQGMQ